MTKEELRDDPVLDWIQNGISFSQRHLRWIAAGAAIVAIVIIGVMTLNRSHERSEREAAELLLDAQRNYLQGATAAAETQLRQLIDSHGRSAPALVARVYLGDVFLSTDRATEALDTYAKAANAAGEDGLLNAAARRGQGAALEMLSRPAEASKSYEEASGFDSPFRSEDLLNAGRTAIAAGDAERAEQLLERAKEFASGTSLTQIEFQLAQAQALRARG